MSDAFWLPTKPYSAEEALARICAATGSVRHARAAHTADFNGHHMTLTWNDYRQWYVGEYWWAGRNVITRYHTKLEEALPAMLDAYDRGGKGSTLIVVPRIDKIEVIRDAESIREADTPLLKSGTVLAHINTRCKEDWEFAEAHPRLTPYSEEIQKAYHATWITWRHEMMTEALSWERNLGVPLSILFEASSKEDWEERRRGFLDARNARRAL